MRKMGPVRDGGLGKRGALAVGAPKPWQKAFGAHDLYPPRCLPRLDDESLEEGAPLPGIISGFATPSESCT